MPESGVDYARLNVKSPSENKNGVKEKPDAEDNLLSRQSKHTITPGFLLPFI
ncbi:hypothetical protein ES705_44674 [subsurface metagenome]